MPVYHRMSGVAFGSVIVVVNRPPFPYPVMRGPILGLRGGRSRWHIENPRIPIFSERGTFFCVLSALEPIRNLPWCGPPPRRFVFTPAGLLFRKPPNATATHTQLPQLPCQGFLIPSQRERAPPELIRILVALSFLTPKPSSFLSPHNTQDFKGY
jgi:hypothetical protein